MLNYINENINKINTFLLHLCKNRNLHTLIKSLVKHYFLQYVTMPYPCHI